MPVVTYFSAVIEAENYLCNLVIDHHIPRSHFVNITVIVYTFRHN